MTLSSSRSSKKSSSNAPAWDAEWCKITSVRADESVNDIITATACILDRICEANDKRARHHPKCAPFVGAEIPDISIIDFCKRLKKYFNCSASCFVVSLMYIDVILSKTQHKRPEERVVLDTLTIHRLMLVSLMLAVKYHEDCHYSAEYYSQVGGVPLKEMNKLEREFIRILDWNMHIDANKFTNYFGELVVHPSVCTHCTGAATKKPSTTFTHSTTNHVPATTDGPLQELSPTEADARSTEHDEFTCHDTATQRGETYHHHTSGHHTRHHRRNSSRTGSTATNTTLIPANTTASKRKSKREREGHPSSKHGTTDSFDGFTAEKENCFPYPSFTDGSEDVRMSPCTNDMQQLMQEEGHEGVSHQREGIPSDQWHEAVRMEFEQVGINVH